jgi:hypothetical protein
MSLLQSERSRRPVLFELTDPAERFIVGVMQRFHTNQRRLYRVLAMRRAEMTLEGARRRLLLQAARFQPQRQGAKPTWEVLVWNMDEPGVRFIRQPSRAAMLALFRSLYQEQLGPASEENVDGS